MIAPTTRSLIANCSTKQLNEFFSSLYGSFSIATHTKTLPGTVIRQRRPDMDAVNTDRENGGKVSSHKFLTNGIMTCDVSVYHHPSPVLKEKNTCFKKGFQ